MPSRASISSPSSESREALPNPTLTRRAFLRATGAAVATLSLFSLRLPGESGAQVAGSGQLSRALPGLPDCRTREDLYREQWRWDRVVRSTHSMTNCTSACAWDLYVKDDLVWREEQKAPYAATMPGLPDFNPRGCQKGACRTSLMYSPSRVRYPLRRVGERGVDRWQRISWDEALAAIATATVDGSSMKVRRPRGGVARGDKAGMGDLRAAGRSGRPRSRAA